MDTIKRKAVVADVLNTAGIIAVLLAVYVVWRTLVGQDNGIVTLFSSLF